VHLIRIGQITIRAGIRNNLSYVKNLNVPCFRAENRTACCFDASMVSYIRLVVLG